MKIFRKRPVVEMVVDEYGDIIGFSIDRPESIGLYKIKLRLKVISYDEAEKIRTGDDYDAGH